MNPHLLIHINNCWRQLANEAARGSFEEKVAIDAIEATDALIRQYVPRSEQSYEMLYAEKLPASSRRSRR